APRWRSFNGRLKEADDEPALIAAACEAVKEAFAAASARFVPPTDGLAKRLAPLFAESSASVLLTSQINDDKLERELTSRRVELAFAIRSGAEPAAVGPTGPAGWILVGQRAYGQNYLSEEMSVLRAIAIETGRTLDNLRLSEARRKQAIDEEELRKPVAQSELMALRAQIN